MTNTKTTKLFEDAPTELEPMKDVVPEAPVEDFDLDDVVISKEEAESMAIKPLSIHTTKQAIEEAKKRILDRADAERALRQAALGFTTHNDWIFHETEGVLIPYLEETGSEKLMHAFGIELEVDNVILEDYREGGEPDDFEVVTYGRVRAQVFSTLWYPVVGSRWAGDGFFSRGGQIRVDPGDVRKAAFASFYNRAIKKVLGLRGVTKEDLDRVPTIDVSKIKTVKHRERRPGGRDNGGSMIADILKVKHLAVFIPYEDVTNRDRFKRVATGCRFHKEKHPMVGTENVWIVPFADSVEKLVGDLVADNGKIYWHVVDPTKSSGEPR
jgi:Arc/MetJ family transcription regulator